MHGFHSHLPDRLPSHLLLFELFLGEVFFPIDVLLKLALGLLHDLALLAVHVEFGLLNTFQALLFKLVVVQRTFLFFQIGVFLVLERFCVLFIVVLAPFDELFGFGNRVLDLFVCFFVFLLEHPHAVPQQLHVVFNPVV